MGIVTLAHVEGPRVPKVDYVEMEWCAERDGSR